jgi:hypothetical protein
MNNFGDYLPAEGDTWGEKSSAALSTEYFIQKPVRLAIPLDKLLPKLSEEEETG